MIGCNALNDGSSNAVFERPSKSDSLKYYFPSILNKPNKNPNYVNFKQKWFSSALYAMREPILYDKMDSLEIYRLLWLRSFHAPFCFTIKKVGERYFLRTVKLDRQPSFYYKVEYADYKSKIVDTIERGERIAFIDFDRTQILSSKEWDKCVSYINSSNFWQRSLGDEKDEGYMDGSGCVFEGRKNGRYQFVIERLSESPLRELCKHLISTSMINIPNDQFY